MARIRANLNSFSTGFVSQRILGNIDFEGYNNGLTQIENFLVQHTGGVFKRGGTEYISQTKNNLEVELLPFSLSFGQSYILEFGDLIAPDEYGNRYYFRAYTRDGLVEGSGVHHDFFSLDELRQAATYEGTKTLNIVMFKGIFTIAMSDVAKFVIKKTEYTYPPLTHMNYDPKRAITVSPMPDSDKVYSITSNVAVFYGSDVGSVLCLTGLVDDKTVRVSLRVNSVITGKAIQAEWLQELNIGSEQKIAEGTEFVEWQISQFTADRVLDDKLRHISVAMYEGRMFIAAGNTVWGSSLAKDDILDFSLGSDDDGGIMVTVTGTKNDDILWIIGKSKLFLATASSLFMSGAATVNDSVVTPRNFGVRAFQAIGADTLLPISAYSAIFFIDSFGRNLHEIVLSSETGAYQANDLSLIGDGLTSSGVIAHTWQQTPIKTYWCAVKDGYLCALTYLKNNGVMAWSKHVISGEGSKVECLATMQNRNSDDIWMVVKRQITNAEGKKEIRRSIEYMHPIYNPLEQEEFKQFFVDSGKVKELKHTIKKITPGYNYSVALSEDIRPNNNIQELKVMFVNMSGVAEYTGPPPNPFISFDRLPGDNKGEFHGYGHTLVARNFRKEGEKFVFDVFDVFDYVKTGGPVTHKYVKYNNKFITHGKIKYNEYRNDWKYKNPISKFEVFVKVSDIRRVDLGSQTVIYCDTSNLNDGDHIVLRNTDLARFTTELPIDFNYDSQEVFKVTNRTEISFVLAPEVGVNVKTGPKFKYSGFGEVYKAVRFIDLKGSDPFAAKLFRAGSDCEFVVSGELSDDTAEVYINKVFGMTEVNNIKYAIHLIRYDEKVDESILTLYDYTKSPDEKRVFIPLDAYGFGVYDIEEENNGNMYEYFTVMDGLDHLEGDEVSVCSNGNSLDNRHVEKLVKGIGFELDQPSMYCVAGLPMTAKLKTVPFSGGNLLGSSVGVVGQQVHAVFNLYYSLGGKYGTEESRIYPFPYPSRNIRPFNASKGLFTGICKLPLINAKNIYERCIYIEHVEPLSFNLLAITEEISVTDA